MHRGWEALIPWLFVALGVIIAFALGGFARWPSGRMTPQHWSPRYCIAAFFVSIAIGIVLIIPTGIANSLCIARRFCVNHGDQNMSYWFHTFLAIPLFWIVMVVTAAYSRDDSFDAES
jgi:hypothetical protein